MGVLRQISRGLMVILLAVVANTASSEERLYGSFIFNSEIPNALFFLNQIKNGDDFQLRKALRNHDIDTVVLASPGGSVWAGLSMAGIIFDKQLSVYVPPQGTCASACSFMFFAGAGRLSEGRLGVHQFASPDTSKTANAVQTQSESQFTVSEIIGFLNEFETPRFVLERMFEDRDMYWFNGEEITLLSSKEYAADSETLGAMSKYTRKKLDLKKKKESEKPRYSEKELIALIQKRLNEIGCSAGVADGIWGKQTNAAAISFAKKVGLPTSGADLVSETFVDALYNASEGTCPKPKVNEIMSFYGNYAVSCNQPGGWLLPRTFTGTSYNRATGLGVFKQKFEGRSGTGQLGIEKTSRRTFIIKFSNGADTAHANLNSKGKVVGFTWYDPDGSSGCTEIVARGY